MRVISNVTALLAHVRVFYSNLLLFHWNMSLRLRTKIVEGVEADSEGRKERF